MTDHVRSVLVGGTGGVMPAVFAGIFEGSVANHDKKMGAFLREVSNWYWDEFVRAEHDESYSSNEAIIFSLVRSCAMQKLEAIKMSLNRLDGKLKTPVNIEMPKVFYLFPNAALPKGPETFNVEAGEQPITGIELTGVNKVTVIPVDITRAKTPEELAEEAAEQAAQEEDLPSLSLRDTLSKMSDYPRELPAQIIATALTIEQAINANGPVPDEIPRVKSVVAAHLLTMAANRNLAAATEVFDQIDGKLAETIQILGEDIYITNFSSVAPAEAQPNADGILQITAEQAQLMWAQKLGKDL